VYYAVHTAGPWPAARALMMSRCPVSPRVGLAHLVCITSWSSYRRAETLTTSKRGSTEPANASEGKLHRFDQAALYHDPTN